MNIMGKWVVYLISFTALSCQERVEQHHVTRGDPSDMSVEVIASLGNDTHDDQIFSIVRAVNVDRQGNLIVFDASLKSIREYDPNLNLLREHALRTGDGPGEFRRASTFALSKQQDKYYIYDQVQRKVSILSRDSLAWISSFHVPTNHAVLHALDDNRILAVFSQLSVGKEGHVMNVYNEDGQHVSYFHFRHESFQAMLDGNMASAIGASTSVYNSHVWISQTYPYDIQRYTLDGIKTLHLVDETIPFYGRVVRQNGFDYPSGSSSSIVQINDNLICQILYNREENQNVFRLFDSRGYLISEIHPEQYNIPSPIFGFQGSVHVDGSFWVLHADSKSVPKLMRLRFVS